MQQTTARRWLAGLAVVGALVAGTAAPAFAQAPDAELGIYLNDSTIAAGSAGKIESPILFASEPVTLPEAQVIVDTRDLAGVATVSDADGVMDCEPPSGGRFTCTLPFEMSFDEFGGSGYVNLLIEAVAGAEEGDSGQLTVSFSAAGFDTVSFTSDVRVGEGVDLAAAGDLELTTRPGGALTIPANVSNVGDTTAAGVVAVFFHDYGINSTQKFSNCTYEGDELRTCAFDQDLAPGAAYGTELTFRMGADTAAPSGKGAEHTFMTPAEFEDFSAYLADLGISFGQPGTGGVLELAEAEALRSRRVQADTDPSNNWTSVYVQVQGKQFADLAAIGASLTGEKGDVVEAEVGLTNKGPATLDSSRSGNSITRVDVKIPVGATAVVVPEECVPFDGRDVDWEHYGKPGAAWYRCPSSIFIKVGDVQTVTFGLRIDKVVPNATGTVTINAKCECDGIQGDLDASNDVAKLVINPAGGTGGGEGDDPGLPLTGAATTSLIAVGVVLVLAGAVGFLVARRRRVRFVA